MSIAMQDNAQCQWLSTTEETLFLHDGLIRVTDLIELPHDVNRELDECDNDLVTFDSKSPIELTERLKTLCNTANNAYANLLEYRMNALRGFWNARYRFAKEVQKERERETPEEALALLKKQGLLTESEPASFSTRVSLLMVLPLLQSHSKLDNRLCGMTANLLLTCLKDCPPLSLNKEPTDCLNGLESLLCTWLGESDEDDDSFKMANDVEQRRNLASALVVLACARGDVKSFVHTVHLLHRRPDVGPLPVASSVLKLMNAQGSHVQHTAILGNKHALCWPYQDVLANSEKPRIAASSEADISRSVASDGRFLFVTGPLGRGLQKIGTGLHGTLRGYVYAKHPELCRGWVAWADGLLLHMSFEFSHNADSLPSMLHILDPYTLQAVTALKLPSAYTWSGPATNVRFCADGMYCYWLWCAVSLGDKKFKGENLRLEVFRVDAEKECVIPLRCSSTIIQKKDDNNLKGAFDSPLSRLRPYNRVAGTGNTATLVALTGTDPQPIIKKEEENLSCGLSLKVLLQTPIYCDGSTLVLMAATQGTASTGAANAARSLFATSSGMPVVKPFAVNLCFDVSTGDLIGRIDVIDAPMCALVRGTPVDQLAVCFDQKNNIIWSCSNEWIDEYINIGTPAKHLVLDCLGIPANQHTTASHDEMLEPSEVIKRLLQHVGSTCVQQLASESSFRPRLPLPQSPVNLTYLRCLCDILEQTAVTQQQDQQNIVCVLVIFQLFFKTNSFNQDNPEQTKILAHTNVDRCKMEVRIHHAGSGCSWAAQHSSYGGGI